MQKSIETNILLKNVDIFKKQIIASPISLLIKILPFLCTCGNLEMYKLTETIVPIDNLPNKDMMIRMSLISENYELSSYLLPKNYMPQSLCLRYYLCSGGNDLRIYNLLDNSENWNAVIDTDIKRGIKNGNIFTIKYILSKKSIPIDNYYNLPKEKHCLILNDELINYYIENNINHEFLIEELYNRKHNNINFIFNIVTLKKFIKKIRYKIKNI